jgi:toxin FitB
MIVLDTNVISELMRANCSPEVSRWLSRQHATTLCTTAITEAEVFYGIEVLAQGKRRESLLSEAEGMFTEDFKGRILPFDSDAARVYAQIVARRRKMGRPIAEPDAQIAAIAQVHQAALATRDVADFAHCDIRVLNPWKS